MHDLLANGVLPDDNGPDRLLSSVVSVLTEAATEVERLRFALARMARGDLPDNYANTGNGYRAFAADTLAPHDAG